MVLWSVLTALWGCATSMSIDAWPRLRKHFWGLAGGSERRETQININMHVQSAHVQQPWDCRYLTVRCALQSWAVYGFSAFLWAQAQRQLQGSDRSSFTLSVLPLKPWELFGQVTSACSLYFSTGPGPSGFCLDWTLWPVTRVHVWNVLSWMITVYLCILSCKTKWNECSLWRQLQLETTNQQLARANQKDPSCSFPNNTDCSVRDSALLRKPRQHQDRANDKPFYGSSCFRRLQCNVTPWQRLFQH